MADSRWVRVARIGKPFGVRGQMTLQVLTDVPEQRFIVGAELARSETGSDPVRLSGVHRVGPRWTIAIDGVADRDQAEAMRGEELYAPAAAAPASDDEWYDWQLVGLPCRSTTGEPLGEVVSVEHPPAHDLLVVRTPDGYEVRVPLVGAIVPSITTDLVTIDPPGGLFVDPAATDEPGPT